MWLHVRYRERLDREEQVRGLETELAGHRYLVMKDDLRAMRKVLKRLQYVDKDGVVTLKGRVACEITTTEELVVTELLFRNTFQTMEVYTHTHRERGEGGRREGGREEGREGGGNECHTRRVCVCVCVVCQAEHMVATLSALCFDEKTEDHVDLHPELAKGFDQIKVGGRPCAD